MLHLKVGQKWLVLLLFLSFILSGCASVGQGKSQEVKPIKYEELPIGNGWWYARFRLAWPPDTEPEWHMDLYIAHQVILPLLQSNKDDIRLWRFHRRAARDKSGRQFSFIFYSSPQMAQHIFETLRTDANIVNMKFSGIIDQDLYDNPVNITRPNLEDTSDRHWPVSIQKSWPWYIMGASQMWLNLITEVVTENMEEPPPATMTEIDAFYKRIDGIVSNMWEEDGRHAFMHHLNAIFEYKPLIYYEKKYFKF